MKKLLILTGFLIFSFTMKAQETKPQDFTGVYKFQSAPFDRIVITYENGVLVAEAEGVGKGEITATNTKDEFSEPNYQALLKFKRDASGTVVRLAVEANGESYEGIKEAVSLNEYAGKYGLEGNAEVTEVSITVQGGSLYIEAAIGGSGLVATEVKDSFHLAQAAGGVVFSRDENGKVTGIEINYSGTTFKGTRK